MPILRQGKSSKNKGDIDADLSEAPNGKLVVDFYFLFIVVVLVS
jgi:hypothetical protein